LKILFSEMGIPQKSAIGIGAFLLRNPGIIFKVIKGYQRMKDDLKRKESMDWMASERRSNFYNDRCIFG
jgi:hypothetical protein